MVIEYIKKLIKAYQTKPGTIAGVGLALTLVFGAMNWILPMYISLGFCLTGYFAYTFSKKNKERANK